MHVRAVRFVIDGAGGCPLAPGSPRDARLLRRRDVERAREGGRHVAVPGCLDFTADVRERATAFQGLTMVVPGGGVYWKVPGAMARLNCGFTKSKRLRLPWPSMIITRRTCEVPRST